MGFPNVDLLLVKIFLNGFSDAQTLGLAIPDVFEEMDNAEQSEIALYLSRIRATDDITERDSGQKYIYILPHFPLAGYPFPQIGISLGQENTESKFLGDQTGESQPVADTNGNIVAWDVVKGYLASATWNVDIIGATKDETIWLSRLCQYFICQHLDYLTTAGVMEVGINLSDVRIDTQLAQPADFFTRTVSVSARVANTWKKRIGAYTYDTGINKSL